MRLLVLMFLIGAIGLSMFSCDDFLDVSPRGELSEKTFEISEEGVEGVIIGVYSLLNGQYNQITNAHRSSPSNWVYGDVVSDDAYKGSSGISDGSDVHQLEVFAAAANNQGALIKWEACYEGVSRANTAINVILNFQGWGEEMRNTRLAEVRVLRGHYYFELKKIYNHIPYINELTSPEAMKTISNRDFTSEQLWDLIEEDFQFATQYLPAVQENVGRVTSVTAWAYLAKTHLYQQEWTQANEAIDRVLAEPGNHYLLDNFEEVFLQKLNNQGNEFCPECLFAVQHSLDPSLPSSTPDVGSTYGWDGNVGDRLSGLGGPYPRVYGFHTPSQNLVNSYKTTESGLPASTNMLRDNDFVDPRLDHTVGRPGIPFFNAGIYSENWTRGVSTYGPYAGKKQLYPVNSETVINIPYYTNSENYCIIRLADLYLMKAECMIELGDLETARQYINQVRDRAKNGGYVVHQDGSKAANYKVEPYASAWNSKEEALQAVRLERRLELAMEGHRFFDLVRWGVAAEVMNAYIDKEKALRTYLNNANFQAGKHEYFPIPDVEIAISQGVLIQNNGY
ncbi:MAG: RagB/SusD family nutrient uptake outer membrane protein [Bacteroidota bacterium]